jgi:hypothetical protein
VLSVSKVRLSNYAVYLAGILLVVLLSACGNPLTQDDSSHLTPRAFGPRPAHILVTDAAFTLLWDAPVEQVTEYRIYIRQHRRSRWTLLADGLSEPSLPVDTSVLEPGSYEFAVSYVCAAGNESPKHTSLDETASPRFGWYLTWEPAGDDG